ncbi:MAG: hypothetical protein VYE00_13170, partial [Candidatus Poribacteria bacterium]|nr:hypothetical protein [Candidatus Poribacteria bacterium]
CRQQGKSADHGTLIAKSQVQASTRTFAYSSKELHITTGIIILSIGMFGMNLEIIRMIVHILICLGWIFLSVQQTNVGCRIIQIIYGH